jgi:hypothetical protein
MKKCYVIKLTTVARTDEERLLFDYGIFDTKELAISKIKVLAKFYADKTDRTIFNESKDDDVKFIVRYECRLCPNNEDGITCDECYEESYELTLVECDYIDN